MLHSGKQPGNTTHTVPEPSAASWRIEPLSDGHGVEAFCCGKPSLDDYIRRYALRNQRNDMGRTFVATEPESKRVCGYYTIASGKVANRDLPEEERRLLPRYPVPVMLIAKLAVDQTSQGCGLGAQLLLDALRLADEASRIMGIRGVEVDALDEDARRFYLKYGFKSLLDDPLHLYLSIASVRKLGLR